MEKNESNEMVWLPAASLLHAVSNRVLVAELLTRFRDIIPATTRRPLPAIGAEWEGGIYAGLTLVDIAPAALVLLPGEAESVNWKDAMAWAEKQNGVLPSRIDALVLFQHLKDRFKDAWYWTSTQYAGSNDYAWIQSFGNGNQNDIPKSNDNRARAVRMVIPYIQ